jgi:hypothetical protein
MSMILPADPGPRLAAWAHQRGWDQLSLLSMAGNTYDADCFSDTSKLPKGIRARHEVPAGENWDETIFNVFKKQNGVIRHFWGSELRYAPVATNQHHRARRPGRPSVGPPRHDAGGGAAISFPRSIKTSGATLATSRQADPGGDVLLRRLGCRQRQQIERREGDQHDQDTHEASLLSGGFS